MFASFGRPYFEAPHLMHRRQSWGLGVAENTIAYFEQKVR